jgi:hypothetical protein
VYIEWVKLNIVPSHIYGRWRKTLDMLITRYSITGNGEEFSCVLFLYGAPEDLISYFRVHFHIRRKKKHRKKEGVDLIMNARMKKRCAGVTGNCFSDWNWSGK